jgi:hypothetical protein
MSSNTKTAFTKILCFVKDLNELVGSKFKNVALYYHLLKKSMTSEQAIEKHVTIFKSWLSENKESVLAGKHKLLNDTDIVYTKDKVFINLKEICLGESKDNVSAIYDHLKIIFYLVDPDHASEIKQAIETKSETKEEEFIDNIKNKIEQNFNDNQYDNPLAATMSMLQSGIFTDIIQGMTQGVDNGEMNIDKLLGSVKGLMGGLGDDEQQEVNGMFNMVTGMLGVSGGASGMSLNQILSSERPQLENDQSENDQKEEPSGQD